MKNLSYKLRQLTISNVDGAHMIMWNDVERLIKAEEKRRAWRNLILGLAGVIIFGYLLLN